MRLTQLQLRNFHVHRATTIDFGPATVITGANDAGKSTLFAAVDWLFNWRNYVEEDHPLHTHRYRGPHPSPPALETGVMVVAKCESLGQRRSHVFGPLLAEGCLRFGRLARLDLPVFDQAAPWLIARPEEWGRLAEETAARGDLRGQPSSQNAESVLATYQAESIDIDGDWWMPAEAVVDVFWFHPAPDIDDLPRASDVVWLQGAEREVEPSGLIRPIVRERLKLDLGDPHQRQRERWWSQLEDPVAHLANAESGTRGGPSTKADEVIELAERVKAAARDAWTESAARMLGRVRNLEFPKDPYTQLDGVIDAAIGDLSPVVDGNQVNTVGAGTRRALALAALDLYRNPALWPEASSIILMIEEPEVGLDAAAQRRVAAALRSLPGHSVQTLVVTHSTILVNAADPAGMRILARAEVEGGWDAPTARTPYHLNEIAAALGATASDVLLARRFLVTEGKTDSGVFSIWALTLGFDLRLIGVQPVEAEGYGPVTMVARLLDVAYREPSIVVVLDNGPDTRKVKRQVEARFGPRVEVHLLDTDEVEGQFPRTAVERWLELQGVSITGKVAEVIGEEFRMGVSKASLRKVTGLLLRRPYQVVRDGIAIAAATTEAEIPQLVKGILLRLGNFDR